MNKVTRTFQSILLAILFSSGLWAQTVPQGISYQAVACDNSGVEYVNQTIRVRASILKDGPNGQPQWIEVHQLDPAGFPLKTDAFGLFTLTIGQGQSQGGGVPNFSDIDWAYGSLWLKMEMDPTGGTNYNFLGANRIWSVPYSLLSKKALSAGTADNATTAGTALDDLDKDPKNELQDLKWDPATGTLSLNPPGNSPGSTPIPLDPSPTNELQSLVYNPATGDISLTPAAAGSQPINLGDNDKDPTNELQKLVYDPNTGTISLDPPQGGGGGSNPPPIVFDPSSTNELQELRWDAATKKLFIQLPGSGSSPNISLPDDSPTNELQELFYDPVSKTIKLVGAGTGGGTGLVVIDDSPTNELQTLTYDPVNNSLGLIPGTGSPVLISDGDRDPLNEIQHLAWDPVNKTLALLPGAGTSVVSIPSGDDSPTNELQTLNYNSTTNQISISGVSGPGSSIQLDDQDKSPTNEIQTLSYNSTSNTISISGATGPGSSIQLADGDKDPNNEIQALTYNPNTKELSITNPTGGNAQSVFLSDGDSNPTNELQDIAFDSTSRELRIFPAPPGSSGKIRLNLPVSPGNADFPDCGTKPEYVVILNPYTVPAGKSLYVTAAWKEITVYTINGGVPHPNSPAMPIIPPGYTIANCRCTGYLQDVCPEITPLFIDLNEAAYVVAGYQVPPGKVLVIKSGIAIDEGKIEVSIDNGVNWIPMVIALSPYEAASRAPTFPPGSRIRRPIGTTMTVTGYLFDQ